MVRNKSRIKLKKFGLRVRSVRTSKGWTLEEMEERGWPSWQHLQKIEAGQKNIGLTTLLALAAALDVRPGELVDALA